MATPNADTVKRMLRTRGAAVAAVTAGAVAAWMLLEYVLQQVISLIGWASTAGLYGLTQDSGYLWQGFAQHVFLYVVPFALGFFLSLWIVAPVSEKLTLAPVITRSVLAVGIGSSLFFIVRVIADILGSVFFDRSFFSNSFPQISFDGPSILVILSSDLQGALLTFVGLLPIGVLAGVLLWHWRKGHPPEFHVSGLIDV